MRFSGLPACLLFILAACQGVAPGGGAAKPVDAARLAAAGSEPGQWLMDGREYNAQRHSPLTQINESNVKSLGLAWFAELDTFRGVEATPLYVDGVIYNTSAFNVTSAYNAKTGRRLWTYDPKVPRENGPLCLLRAGGTRSRLLEAQGHHRDARRPPDRARCEEGTEVWTAKTFDNTEWPWTITGAPRVFDGMVVVGNGGADLGVRGFVSAWDADTGKFLWKFFTVPGDPAKGFENAADGQWPRKPGTASGGSSAAAARPGIPSPTIPSCGLVYVGTGNGSPVAREHRSPRRWRQPLPLLHRRARCEDG